MREFVVGQYYTHPSFVDVDFMVTRVEVDGLGVVWYRRTDPDLIFGSDYLQFKDRSWANELIETTVRGEKDEDD